MNADVATWRDRMPAAFGASQVQRAVRAAGWALFLAWLAGAPAGAFDLAFLDPPTFSNSKRMEREFDVQRDHVELIRAASRLLSPGGLLLFSTNFRKFRLDLEALAGLEARDITKATLPFSRKVASMRSKKIAL